MSTPTHYNLLREAEISLQASKDSQIQINKGLTQIHQNMITIRAGHAAEMNKYVLKTKEDLKLKDAKIVELEALCAKHEAKITNLIDTYEYSIKQRQINKEAELEQKNVKINELNTKLYFKNKQTADNEHLERLNWAHEMLDKFLKPKNTDPVFY